IAAWLVRAADRPRTALSLAALFGATLGIGFGFRNDLLIVVPLIVVALFAWTPPRTMRAAGLRAGAMAVAAVTCAIVAYPILSGYTRGSNSGHVALLGFVTPFDKPLGVTPSVYEWSHLYSDGYTDAIVESYSTRVHKRPAPYLSAEYDHAA